MPGRTYRCRAHRRAMSRRGLRSPGRVNLIGDQLNDVWSAAVRPRRRGVCGRLQRRRQAVALTLHPQAAMRVLLHRALLGPGSVSGSAALSAAGVAPGTPQGRALPGGRRDLAVARCAGRARLVVGRAGVFRSRCCEPGLCDVRGGELRSPAPRRADDFVRRARDRYGPVHSRSSCLCRAGYALLLDCQTGAGTAIPRLAPCRRRPGTAGDRRPAAGVR